MSDRMTDERLAEIEQSLTTAHWTTKWKWVVELLQALKAEREYTRNLKESLDGAELDNDGLVDRITALKRDMETLREFADGETARLEKSRHRIRELETLLTEYKDAEYRAVKERGEALKRITELEAVISEMASVLDRHLATKELNDD